MRKADTTASIHVHVASLPPWAHLVGLLMACTPVSVGGRTRQGTVRSGIWGWSQQLATETFCYLYSKMTRFNDLRDQESQGGVNSWLLRLYVTSKQKWPDIMIYSRCFFFTSACVSSEAKTISPKMTNDRTCILKVWSCICFNYCRRVFLFSFSYGLWILLLVLVCSGCLPGCHD